MGIAAPVKLTVLCRSKSNSHLLCVTLVLDTYAHSSYPRFNFSPEVWIFYNNFFPYFALDDSFAWGFPQSKIDSHPVAAAPMAPTAAPPPPHTRPLASLHFTHLWGQLCAPLLSQRCHTHSAKPHSSLSAPASPLFLTVPQWPPSTGPQRHGFLWEQIIVVFLVAPSICSPLWWHTHYLFYDWGLNLNPLSPSVTRHTMAFSLSTGVSFLQHFRAP